jgi:HD-GYP domain-containing protein (c-di-GMP phosphodiesterase class II)
MGPTQSAVPAAEPDLAPGPIAPWHAASAATTDEAVLTSMRILIVDDQAFNIAHHLQRHAERRADELDDAVRARTIELEEARLESLSILAAVSEYHDDDTHQHTQRVGATAARLAQVLDLPKEFVNEIRRAAPLHDLGKVAIPQQILLKPGPLTDDERALEEICSQAGCQFDPAVTEALLELDFETLDEGASSVHG